MSIEVHWQYTNGDDDSLSFSRVLYAYLHPKSSEFLYIGKADYCTVKERLFGAHKEEIFDRMVTDLGIRQLHAIVGIPVIGKGKRLTSELLSDIESLLIFEVQPPYNTQSRLSRISRPGMVVQCFGEWPSEYVEFIDE